MLYTRAGSWPAPLPHAITLANGFIRTDPSSFTADEISDAGYVAAPAQPEYDPLTEQLGWDGEAWTVTALPPPSGEEINAERDRRIAEGKTFNVSGHGDVVLQGRIQDQMVLQARLNAALMKKAAGSTAADLFIRDKNNVIHYLTPDQMIELVSEGIDWIEETMQVSWAMKDATTPFTAGAPFDYTEDHHWP